MSSDVYVPHWQASPNFGSRRDGLKPQFVVLHYTAMDSGQAALERLCDPAFEVSAHYLISNTGYLWQMVEESMRAWHAGAGQWRGLEDLNSRSIGIELDNRGMHPFSEPQMRCLEGLLGQIMRRWSIPAENIIGHSCMAPGRKHDPGPRFDWQRLARQGLAQPGGSAHAVRDAEDKNNVRVDDLAAAFRKAACAYGFPADVSDALLLHTVRLRFAPWRTQAQIQGQLEGQLEGQTPPLTYADIALLPSA